MVPTPGAQCIGLTHSPGRAIAAIRSGSPSRRTLSRDWDPTTFRNPPERPALNSEQPIASKRTRSQTRQSGITRQTCMLRAFLITWTVGAALAALGVLYVADWRPELAPDNRAVAPTSTASGSTAARRSVRNDAGEVADPETTGSVEPARRRSAEAPGYTDPPSQSATVAEARQPRRVGPPAVLLPAAPAPQDKGEKPAVAAREAVADKPAAKLMEAEAPKSAGSADSVKARTGKAPAASAVAAAPRITPIEDFEAPPTAGKPEGSAAPRVSSARDNSAAPPRANARPEADREAASRETTPMTSPLLRTAVAPRRTTPQIEERPSATHVSPGEESATEASSTGLRRREGASARVADRSAETPRAKKRAAKKLARETDVDQASVRRVARTARPTYVARRGGGLERTLDDFSQSGADYLRERTYRVSGGYLVERTTRYGSQYVLERSLRPVPW
jgi:hypothetical protein